MQKKSDRKQFDKTISELKLGAGFWARSITFIFDITLLMTDISYWSWRAPSCASRFFAAFHCLRLWEMRQCVFRTIQNVRRRSNNYVRSADVNDLEVYMPVLSSRLDFVKSVFEWEEPSRQICPILNTEIQLGFSFSNNWSGNFLIFSFSRTANFVLLIYLTNFKLGLINRMKDFLFDLN